MPRGGTRVGLDPPFCGNRVSGSQQGRSVYNRRKKYTASPIRLVSHHLPCPLRCKVIRGGEPVITVGYSWGGANGSGRPPLAKRGPQPSCPIKTPDQGRGRAKVERLRSASPLHFDFFPFTVTPLSLSYTRTPYLGRPPPSKCSLGNEIFNVMSFCMRTNKNRCGLTKCAWDFVVFGLRWGRHPARPPARPRLVGRPRPGREGRGGGGEARWTAVGLGRFRGALSQRAPPGRGPRDLVVPKSPAVFGRGPGRAGGRGAFDLQVPDPPGRRAYGLRVLCQAPAGTGPRGL
jgi:hypothetical protein